MDFNWTCPYCTNKTIITSVSYSRDQSQLLIANAEGKREVQFEWIVCPNEDCKRITLTATMHEIEIEENEYKKLKIIKTWRLLPFLSARVFPEYIPIHLINGYEEASSILELSPSASAALSR